MMNLKADMIEKEFVFALTEHRLFGHILVPFLISKTGNGAFYTVITPVISANIGKLDFEFTDIQKKLIDITAKYSEENLTKKFSRKQGSKEFFHNIDPEIFNKHISPYIDKQVVEIIDVIRKNNIRLFHKPVKYNNVYEDEVIEILEDHASAIFNFDLTSEGLNYNLQINFKDQPLKILFRKPVMISDMPCRMVINNKLYSFDNISGKRLMPFLEKEFVKVPLSATEKYLKTFVYNIVRDHNINASGFDVINLNSEKKAIITIETGLDLEPMLTLRFQYGSKRFTAEKKGKVEVEFKNENGKFTFYKHLRDTGWETDIVSYLKSHGLALNVNRLEISKESDLFKDEPRYAVINWINRLQNEFSQKDIYVEQNMPEHKYFTGTQKLEINIKSEDDWFDLYAVVSFGDFKIPFIRLKKNILNNRREYLLPNGEIVILPAEWFVSFKEILPFAEGGNENLKFAKHHFKLLKENLKGINPEVVKKIKDISNQKFELLPRPEGLKAELRSYQQAGYSWLYSLGKKNFGGCLADDMGLGKTLQTLALLLKLKAEEIEIVQNTCIAGQQLTLFDEPKKQKKASLIIVPTSLVHNWHNEVKKFTPQLKVYRHTGTQRKKIASINTVAEKYDIIITTYGTIRNDYEQLREITFNYIILDESQNIKNPGSKAYKSVLELKSNHKLVLTGTPIENSLSDLWAQINFLNRDLLGNFSFFQKEFIQPIEKRNDEEKQKQLNNLIFPFILRRTKEEVATDLPPLTEQIRYCEMTEMQKSEYETQKSIIRNNILENIEKLGVKNSSFLVLQGLTRLRQLANHPALLGNEESDSGKFNEIMDSLEELISEKNKVLVFSSFVTHLNIFRREFDKLGWDYCLLTGQTTNREEVINDFQTNPSKKIFLISLKAGGVGLNLTAADYIFILDPWWNPASENQAISRAHRIGQDKKVFVYRFITSGTIEEKIQTLKERKSALADKFIHSGRNFSSISAEEVIGLFS